MGGSGTFRDIARPWAGEFPLRAGLAIQKSAACSGSSGPSQGGCSKGHVGTVLVITTAECNDYAAQTRADPPGAPATVAAAPDWPSTSPPAAKRQHSAVSVLRS